MSDNTAVTTSKKGIPKVPYESQSYPTPVNNLISSIRELCENTHNGIFQNAWMAEKHIQLEYIFEDGLLKTTKSGNKFKLSWIMLNHPKDKSCISACHIQGMVAKDRVGTMIKASIDELRAQFNSNSPPRTVIIGSIKQHDYIHRDQMSWLLQGAGATNVSFVPIENEVVYGVKLTGNFNGVSFRVIVYKKFSGALNQKNSKRSAVWEQPHEDDPRIQPFRRTLDAGIESNKYLQRQTALLSSANDSLPSAEKLTTMFTTMVIVD